MTTGLGVDPLLDANGVPTKGTTSSDVRKIFGGLYTPGVISGAVVTTSNTGMTYSVSAGVVAIPTATGEVVLAPVPATTIAVTAPASGSRTDIIYAFQQFAGNENDVDVIIQYGPTVPSRAVELSRFTMPAGASVSSSAISAGGINFSIPYGGTLGVLMSAQSTFNGIITDTPNTDTYYLNGTFYLPTDRYLRLSLSVSVSTEDGQDGSLGNWVEPGYWPQIDNADMVRFNFRATGTWQTYLFQYDTPTPVAAGTHTARMRRNIYSAGGRRAYLHYGGGNIGSNYTITDLGVAQ